MSKSTAVIHHSETSSGEPKGIARLILHERVRPKIEAFLPKGTEIDRVVAAAQLAVKDNRDLLKCDPDSIIRSISRIYARGGEIGITSYLVPFKDSKTGEYTCTDIDDYKFLAQLMTATGAVKHVQLDVVLEGEHFEYERGLQPSMIHKPHISDRVGKKIVGAYVVLHCGFGVSIPLYKSVDEIEAVRARSRAWNPGRVRELPVWYAKKTPLREAAKTALTNVRLAKFFGNIVAQVQHEERAEFGDDAEVGVVTPGAAPLLNEGNPASSAYVPQSDDDEEMRRSREEEKEWVIKED